LSKSSVTGVSHIQDSRIAVDHKEGMPNARRMLALLPLIAIAWTSAVSAMGIPQAPPASSGETSVQPQVIDLTRYYPSRVVAMGELDALERETATFPEKALASDIGAYLQRADGLIGRGRRLDVYFTIIAAQDINDQAAKTAKARTNAAHNTINAKVDGVLQSLSAGALTGADSHVQHYGYLITQMADEAHHALPADVMRVLDSMTGSSSAAYWTIYQKTQRLPVAKPGREPASAGDERLTREAEWRDRWLAADARADVNAATLLAIVNQGEKVARLRRYPDAASMDYAERGLDRGMVERSLAAVRSNLALYQAYHRFRAARLKAMANIVDPEPWDMSLLRGGSAPHFTFDDARRIVPAALAPLGSAYVAHFTALLAPGSGRIDIATVTGNRESGGFSVNAPGVPSGLYMASFDGSINDLRVVDHEGGHAVAAQLANEGNTSSFFAEGPNWLMESYAIFDELLLFDYLARTSASATEQAYYRGLLLEDMMFQVFGSAEEATLEQAIYDGVAAGKIQSATDLNECTFDVIKGFEPWSDDILHASSVQWSTKRLFFQDPFYLVNYMYAGMIAINLYKAVKEHPDTFPAQYQALLRRGYDAPPMTLLAPILGKGITGDTLATNAFRVMQDEVHSASALDGK
jgi:oligoendopeptidase F